MRKSALLPLALLAANVSAAAGEPADWTGALGRAVESGDVPRTVRMIDAAAAGRRPGAAKAFALAFDSENVWIRRAALRGIAVVGGGRLVEALVAALEDPGALVRLDACILAGLLGPAPPGTSDVPPDRARLVEALVNTLSDDRRGVRAEAARALGRLGAASACADLSVTASRDRDRAVRAAAVEALGRTGGEDAPSAVREALEQDDDRVRAAAARALGVLGGALAAEALEPALKDVSRTVRRAAAGALALVGTDEAVGALTRALSLRDEDIRADAARALGGIGSVRAREALRAALRRHERELRRVAAQALGHLGDGAAVDGIMRLIRDSDPEVRAAAVEALGRIADPRSAAAVRISFTDTAAEVRARAAEAAGRLGDAASIPELVRITGEKFSEGERVAGAAALGFLGDERVAGLLVALLDDPSEALRRTAAAALGRLGLRGKELLARSDRFEGEARVEYLGALALVRTPRARALFERELARPSVGEPARFACEVGLYLLGDRSRRARVVKGALGERAGVNPTLAITALVLARDREAEAVARHCLGSRARRLRESAALALGVARPQWAGPLLRRAAADPHPGVRLRARVGLRWLALRKPPP